jgi:ATP adenylyltransferase
MERLWTPWRYDYVTRAASVAPDSVRATAGVPAALNAWPETPEDDRQCVFCNMIAAVDYAIANGIPAEEAEKAVHLVLRGERCFVCLNAFPYSNGHVLILPYAHVDSLAALDSAAANEMIGLAQRLELALRSVYRPNGINFGLNLGEAAGAGVAGHVHMHALPRWIGDTSFITVTADTRVLPETLDTTWVRLREILKK